VDWFAHWGLNLTNDLENERLEQIGQVFSALQLIDQFLNDLYVLVIEEIG